MAEKSNRSGPECLGAPIRVLWGHSPLQCLNVSDLDEIETIYVKLAEKSIGSGPKSLGAPHKGAMGGHSPLKSLNMSDFDEI